MAIQKLPKIKFYRGFKSGLRKGEFYTNEGSFFRARKVPQSRSSQARA
jgi:hypothetical protein